MNKEKLYSVKEVCDKYNITRKTLFYYDKTELVLPSERLGTQQHKMYSYSDLIKLEETLRYRSAGLTIEEIKNIRTMDVDDEIDYLGEIKERLLLEKKDKEKEIKELNSLIEERMGN